MPHCLNLKSTSFSRSLAAAIAAPLLMWVTACSKAPDTPAAVARPANAVIAPAAPASVNWIKPDDASLDAIFAKAKADNTPVLLYWGAVWCPPCNQIKATVFNRPDFIEKSRAFAPVYLDGDTPGAQKLATQFKTRGYPTTILFKPDGTELTRLPGEVDAVQFMKLLSLGMAATQGIKETLAQALAGSRSQPPLTADAWRMLAYYAWDTDEAQLVPKKDLGATVLRLAQECPAQFQTAALRLTLKATAITAQEKLPGLDKAQALAAVKTVLADATLSRDNVDMLSYYGNDIVGAVAPQGSSARKNLLASLNAALDRLAGDTTLSKADQLGAAQAKVTLTEIDWQAGAAGSTTPIPVRPARDPAVVAMARDAATKADRTTRINTNVRPSSHLLHTC